MEFREMTDQVFDLKSTGSGPQSTQSPLFLEMGQRGILSLRLKRLLGPFREVIKNG